MTHDTYGRTSPQPFAYYDPASSSLRTFEATFDSDSTPYSGTLPTWGSMRSGVLSARPTPAHPTAGSGSSSSQLLGTPGAMLGEGGGVRSAGFGEGRAPNPQELVRLLATPHANASTGPGAQGRDGGLNLQTQIGALLPTPKARDVKDAALGNTIRNRPGHRDDQDNLPAAVQVHLLPTPRATDGPKGGPGQRNGRGRADSLPAIGALRPTPTVNDMGAGKTPEQWDTLTEGWKAKHGKSLEQESLRLMDTPRSHPVGGMDHRGGARSDELLLAGQAKQMSQTDFGPYTAAVERWEQVLGRPAPEPSIDLGKGLRLNPAFVEFMMGLPQGHVTDVPDVSRSAALKMLGNGVVPQQALLALRLIGGR